jgi:archaellum component FlaC
MKEAKKVKKRKKDGHERGEGRKEGRVERGEGRVGGGGDGSDVDYGCDAVLAGDGDGGGSGG